MLMNPVTPSFTYVYVIRSEKSGMLYTGCTLNVRKRLDEHNGGKSTYTKGRGPFELIYFEAYKDSKDAHAREKHLKSGPGKNNLKQRNRRFLGVTG